jgi:hypothetical protein
MDAKLLAQARAASETRMTSSATIYPETLLAQSSSTGDWDIPEGPGNPVGFDPNVHTKCSLTPLSADERIKAGFEATDEAYKAAFPYSTYPNADQKVSIDGVAYEVKGVLAPPSEEAVHVIVLLYR